MKAYVTDFGPFSFSNIDLLRCKESSKYCFCCIAQKQCHFNFISCKIFSNNFYVFSVKLIVKNGEFLDIHGSSRYDFVSDIWFVLILVKEHVLFFQIFKMCYLAQHVVSLGKRLLSQLNRTWFWLKVVVFNVVEGDGLQMLNRSNCWSCSLGRLYAYGLLVNMFYWWEVLSCATIIVDLWIFPFSFL